MTAIRPSDLKSLAPLWPWLAVLASAAMLGAAHAFEKWGGLLPCALCLRQREIYWGALTIGLVGLASLRFVPRPQLGRTLNVFLGLAFLTGGIIAGYHVAVEQGWVLAQCEGFGTDGDLALGSGDAPVQGGRCDAPSWRLFGLSMAGYNSLVSIVLAALSFTFAVLTPVRPELSRD
jgi:disulfide bond formation protein DsbB